MPPGGFGENLGENYQAPPPKYQDENKNYAGLKPPNIYHRLIQNPKRPLSEIPKLQASNACKSQCHLVDLSMPPGGFGENLGENYKAPPPKYQDENKNYAGLKPPNIYHRLIQNPKRPLSEIPKLQASNACKSQCHLVDLVRI
ncbi:hypothetical protein RUM44_011314 [Polyplax serrata]|uniref:Uncharacterized protein n=1 Tax=Polyplax serrata TaxID=468196 RepID=A0ABR1APR5_POLSC